MGRVVDFLGRPYPLVDAISRSSAANGGSQAAPQHPEAAEGAEDLLAAAGPQIGADERLPLLNSQPDMDSREQINEPLLTGVKVGGRIVVCVLLGTAGWCVLRHVLSGQLRLLREHALPGPARRSSTAG